MKGINLFRSQEWVVLMALPQESQGLFENAGIPLIYTGIGKINAAAAITETILNYPQKKILNLGTAGSFALKTHELVECRAFVQRDMDLTPLKMPLGETPLDAVPGKIIGTHFFSELKGGVCGTGDVFEVEKTKLPCDLVDMEAYALAKVCKKKNVEFISVKYITDQSNRNTHVDWKANLQKSARALLQFYEKYWS